MTNASRCSLPWLNDTAERWCFGRTTDTPLRRLCQLSLMRTMGKREYQILVSLLGPGGDCDGASTRTINTFEATVSPPGWSAMIQALGCGADLDLLFSTLVELLEQARPNASGT